MHHLGHARRVRIVCDTSLQSVLSLTAVGTDVKLFLNGSILIKKSDILRFTSVAFASRHLFQTMAAMARLIDLRGTTQRVVAPNANRSHNERAPDKAGALHGVLFTGAKTRDAGSSSGQEAIVVCDCWMRE